MKMKQKMKRLLACTLALAMLMTLSVVTEAQAAVKDSFPDKARIYYYGGGFATGDVDITLADKEKSIANVKSKDKNLIAKLTEQEIDIRSEKLESNRYTIGLGTEKSGTYTVTYDIVKNGKTLDTKKVTVYVYPSPLKSISINGKDNYFYGTAKTGKVKVTLLPGYTIQKLEIGTYKKVTTKQSDDDEYITSKLVYKTFKNGSKVTFGTNGYYEKSHYGDPNDDSEYAYYDAYYNNSLFSDTIIRITYKDKYTKQTETIQQFLSGYAK